MSENRLALLADRCVQTHCPSDIIRHMREEMGELNEALDRWERDRSDVTPVVEEACDVLIDITVFRILLALYDKPINWDEMFFKKLNKFQKMLEEENEAVLAGLLSFPINRYHTKLEYKGITSCQTVSSDIIIPRESTGP